MMLYNPVLKNKLLQYQQNDVKFSVQVNNRKSTFLLEKCPHFAIPPHTQTNNAISHGFVK